MMTKCLFAILIASFLLVGVALAGENCMTCGSSMYFTGETRVDWGKLQKLYKCPSGHAWWINSSPSTSRPGFSSGPVCPTCGASVYFTGETYVEWGKLHKIYKCPSGHRSVGR